MTNSNRSILQRISDRIPISRPRALCLVHLTLVQSTRTQVLTKLVQCALHALEQRTKHEDGPQYLWWKAQTVKWETIWLMVNEVCSDLSDPNCSERLHRVSDAAFELYEQLTIGVATMHQVSLATIRTESLRWRELGALLLLLRMQYLNLPVPVRTSKTTGNSGITDMKEV